MMMRRRNFLATGGAWTAISALSTAAESASTTGEPFSPNLEKIRSLSTTIPGELPTAVNVVKVADSIRPERVIMEGGTDKPHVMARTLYQLAYPDHTFMIDTGMDAETHRQFGAEGKPFTDPFYQENYQQVLTALDQSKGIFITHFHADHVGGLIRSPNRASLLPKCWITRDTARLMADSPHKPAVAIDAAELESAILFDYEDIFPIAPGLVAIKAPAHSLDHQMLYARLANGREFLFSIDSAWHMNNIRLGKLKAAPWVKEDRPRLLEHYRWLKEIDETEEALTVLVTHDNDQLVALTGSGVLGGTLKLF